MKENQEYRDKQKARRKPYYLKNKEKYIDYQAQNMRNNIWKIFKV
jgi:hypothetical protein